MEHILSFKWLIKHPISIPFFFGRGTSFQALCGGNGGVKCRILFTFHPTKFKGIALAGHMKLWIMGPCYFCEDFYCPCNVIENRVCNISSMVHWYNKDQSKFWRFLKLY